MKLKTRAAWSVHDPVNITTVVSVLTKQDLQDLAQRKGVSLARYVRRVLRQHVKENQSKVLPRLTKVFDVADDE